MNKTCSLCGKRDETVNRRQFDGMCADCIDEAFAHPHLFHVAITNNLALKRLEDSES